MARIMGIVNVTPDSFWSGSRVEAVDALLERVRFMLDNGAHAIDMGGCSTRPNSIPATEEEEMDRLEWSLETVRGEFPHLLLSVDTYRPTVAERCVDMWHVGIINDVSGGGSAMYELVARSGAQYVLTWADEVRENLMTEMMAFFEQRLEMMRACGVDVMRQVILDPGFGFGKSLDQNYMVLSNMDRLKKFGVPLLAGLSRKSMAYKLLGITPQEALNATAVMNTVALMNGADWLRVHDVLEAVQAVKIINEVTENKL